MTITNLLKDSRLPQQDRSLIGHAIGKKARELGVTPQKVEEKYFVNDYPEEFLETMRTVVKDYMETKLERDRIAAAASLAKKLSKPAAPPVAAAPPKRRERKYTNTNRC